MLRRLLPRETSFFDFFEQHSKLSIEVCRELHAIALNPQELDARVKRINDIEHEADDITRKCIDALHRTFVTPIDRSDIHRLMTRLDDIIDAIDSAVSRMILYKITSVRPEFVQFSEILLRATTEIDSTIINLRNLKQGAGIIEKSCRAIYEAENAGDQVLRASLARLFKEEKETVIVLKWKGIFDRLERAADYCEEVANIIEGIVIEAS